MQQLSFNYVQGMNVLAAPFLYTMQSQVEAFWCFTKFIEESCPLYVQPTLEGVHRGLKVRLQSTRDVYASRLSFTASRPVLEDCGSRLVRLSPLQESLR